MTEALILSAILTIFALFFTLAWWKIADRWADKEHKRFKQKPKYAAPRVASPSVPKTTPTQPALTDEDTSAQI